jgi:hypothetical protein
VAAEVVSKDWIQSATKSKRSVTCLAFFGTLKVDPSEQTTLLDALLTCANEYAVCRRTYTTVLVRIWRRRRRAAGADGRYAFLATAGPAEQKSSALRWEHPLSCGDKREWNGPALFCALRRGFSAARARRAAPGDLVLAAQRWEVWLYGAAR